MFFSFHSRSFSLFLQPWVFVRNLLIGMGIGLFTSPNQTRLMSVGARETMGAASALSNLVARLGTVCGPLLVGLVWTFFASESTQMGVGILLIDGFAVLNLLFAWLSIQRRARGVSTTRRPEPTTSSIEVGEVHQ
jgi:predicted MFS family arabinose efflux permease